MPSPNAHLKPREQIVQVGEVAPDFTLPSQAKGESFKLSDALKKGEVIISFFPFAFTGVCGTEMECLTKELETFKAHGHHGQPVGLSCDSAPALRVWAEQLHLKHPLLADLHREVCKAYGLYWPEMNVAWRGTVVVGQDGKVKWSQKREISQPFSKDEVLAHM